MTVSVTPTQRDWVGPIAPVTLKGPTLTLVPVDVDQDYEALFNAVGDPHTFDYYPHGPIANAKEYKQKLQKELKQGYTPFKVVRGDKLVGSVSLLSTIVEHKQSEIGAIWVNPECRGSNVLVEIAYILLSFCFETLKFNRVQWKTHHENFASQKAAIKIGMTHEGVLRNHIIMYDGTLRHSYYYSAIIDEWPKVKDMLEAKLKKA